MKRYVAKRSCLGLSRFSVLAAAIFLCAASGTSQAQFGYGWGWGMGMGGQIGNMAIMNNINDRSSSAANYAYSVRQNIPGTGSVYAGNPNSYMNSIRGTTFNQTFDVSTRRTTSQAAARASARRSTSTNEAPKNVILPLVQFFSAAGKLIWPGDVPTTGDLGDKKTRADASVESVFQEVKGRGFAPLGLVTDARTRLVEYGQPALEYLTQHAATPAVDAFHQFLLSLYDSLGAAGTAKRN